MTVETFTRRTTTVDTLTEAFAFIMGEVDGFTRPSIEIRPFTRLAYSTDESSEHFEVTVSGVKENPDAS